MCQIRYQRTSYERRGRGKKRSNLKPTTKTNILLNLNLYVGNKRGIKYGI